MKDLFKTLFAFMTLNWLFGSGSGGNGCGCGGCLTALILGACLILYMLGLLQ